MARRRRRSGIGAGVIVLIVILVLLLAGAGAVAMWANGEVKGNRGNAEEVTLIIEKGSGTSTISNVLKKEGVIRSAQLFRFYVKQKGMDGSMQYGEFTFTSDMPYDAIIETMQKTTDDRETVRVTFPEGIPSVYFAKRMEEAGLCTMQEFLDVANNEDFSQFKFWAQRGENPQRFMMSEGYLFPDTYDFYVGDTVYNMVAKLYGAFDAKFTDEMYQRMNELNMSLHDVIVLASLIQEEAGNEFSKQVSAVFHNRLKTGMTLGSNVAWDKEKADDNNYIYDVMAGQYGFGSWDAIPAEMRAAYDTYTHTGLPAGAVSNPGIAAIEAALWPEENSEYYFFQTDTLGNYHFAKTNAEHEQITADLEKQGIRP